MNEDNDAPCYMMGQQRINSSDIDCLKSTTHASCRTGHHMGHISDKSLIWSSQLEGLLHSCNNYTRTKISFKMILLQFLSHRKLQVAALPLCLIIKTPVDVAATERVREIPRTLIDSDSCI